MVGFISVTNLFLLATPVSVFCLTWMQHRATVRVAERVEAMRKTTAVAAEDTAFRVAETVLRKTSQDKADTDEKLEVIRKDVNSNLTAALAEIEALKSELALMRDKTG